jgi:hypothetical protein
MKTTLFCRIACIGGLLAFTQCSPHMQPATNNTLLGVQPRSAFHQHWFDSTYQAYRVHSPVKPAWKDEKIDIFLGTWCGDSRREVPRMLKVLDNMKVPASSIRLICTKSGDPGHKTSPGREEQGLYIFRVPTFIIYRDGREIGRIVEAPVQSLEEDLAGILDGKPYQSNYAAGEQLRRLFERYSPDDILARQQQYADELKPLAKNVSELSSFGSVLLSAGDNTRAIAAFRLNSMLFPEKAIAWQWLAEGYRRNHDNAAAVSAYQRALELAPGEASFRGRMDSLIALR